MPFRLAVLQPEGLHRPETVSVVIFLVAVVAVHVGHHQDEILRQAAGAQGIQAVEHVRAVDPGLLIAAGAVEEIHDRIALERVPIIIFRQVDDHAALRQLLLAAGIIHGFDDAVEARQGLDVPAFRTASVAARGAGTEPGRQQDQEQETPHQALDSRACRNMPIRASMVLSLSNSRA